MTRLVRTLFRPRPGRLGVVLCLAAQACGGDNAIEPPSGTLDLQVTGLDPAVNADIRVTGPGSYSRTVAGSARLTGLASGTYTVSAGTIAEGGNTWLPSSGGQSGMVAAGNTSVIAVHYTTTNTSSIGGVNLRIDGLYLTQAVQRYDGSVPLVAGRNAYLRVFGVASRAIQARPEIRVRLYQGITSTLSYTLKARADSVPAAVIQGDLRSTWNVMVPGNFVVPGLRVVAEIDPAGLIEETNENDNLFPASGTPGAIDVRALPAFRVRFVPILQQANGLQGNVTPATADRFLADLRVLLPVAGYEAEVRAPYSTTAPPLESDNANDAWGTILSELNALKRIDRNSQYYYGVVKTGYTSGVGGIGYVGGGSRVALGWDRLPSGAYVMAHEVAHNMGRSHAPCGVSGADPGFPHPGGKIGAWGFDPVWLSLKNPALWVDLTGYCNPYWVSDYSWEAMLAYRLGAPNNSPRLETATGPGLLVWGRITPRGPVLEPAFPVDQGAALPAPGPHRIEALAADGSVLFTVPFAAERVADLPTGPEDAFAFVLPAGALLDRVAELRLVVDGRVARQRSRGGAALPTFELGRDSLSRTLTWDATRYPMLLIRDRGTGEVLSFARGGRLRLPAGQRPLDLVVSDGVRSRQLK